MGVPMNYDLLVIGGGINGVAVAADAAGRGLRVLLCEKDDLANHTSWASTKLIHGGLRYLENYDFKLVRESLLEREILLKKAPFLIHPVPFILPHAKHLRPKWLIRLGLFLYDHLAKRKRVPSSRSVDLLATEYGHPLKKEYKKGFLYYDCQTDDVRLVTLTALAAKEKGAEIQTRTQVVSAKRLENEWLVALKGVDRAYSVKAKAIVNATGAWVADVLHNALNISTASKVTLVKGSHFTVPKLYDGHHCYVLQHTDNRIIFVIPYEEKYTLIGTTDVRYEGDPQQIEISPKEVDYLCRVVSTYFKKPVDPKKINWTFSGVRALYDDAVSDPSKITREYHLDLQAKQGKLPVLSVFGGKLTTHRLLAEAVLDKLKPFFPEMKKPWTEKAKLPGANGHLKETFSGLPDNLKKRLWKSYGSRANHILANANSLSDLGEHIGADLYEAEVKYLVENEWVKSAEDLMWRRSKLGLFLTEEQVAHLSALIQNLLKIGKNG